MSDLLTSILSGRFFKQPQNIPSLTGLFDASRDQAISNRPPRTQISSIITGKSYKDDPDLPQQIFKEKSLGHLTIPNAPYFKKITIPIENNIAPLDPYTIYSLNNARGKTFEELLSEPSLNDIPGFSGLSRDNKRILLKKRFDALCIDTQYPIGSFEHGLASAIKTYDQYIVSIFLPGYYTKRGKESYQSLSDLMDSFKKLMDHWRERQELGILHPARLVSLPMAQANNVDITGKIPSETLYNVERYFVDRWNANGGKGSLNSLFGYELPSPPSHVGEYYNKALNQWMPNYIKASKVPGPDYSWRGFLTDLESAAKSPFSELGKEFWKVTHGGYISLEKAAEIDQYGQWIDRFIGFVPEVGVVETIVQAAAKGLRYFTDKLSNIKQRPLTEEESSEAAEQYTNFAISLGRLPEMGIRSGGFSTTSVDSLPKFAGQETFIEPQNIAVNNGFPVLKNGAPVPSNGMITLNGEKYELITVKPTPGPGVAPVCEIPNVIAKALSADKYEIIDPKTQERIGIYSTKSGRYLPRIRGSGKTDEEFFDASDNPPFQVMRDKIPYDPNRRTGGDFDPSINGQPALRSSDGQPIQIKRMLNSIPSGIKKVTKDEFDQKLLKLLERDPATLTNKDSDKLARETEILIRKDQVLPFISSKTTPEQRANLYNNNVEARRITINDVPLYEHGLINQYGVFAKREFKKGDVIGVYGGYLLTKKTIPSLSADDAYLMTISPKDKAIVISGTNSMSRINTIFSTDSAGNLQQASSGYNVDTVYYEIQISSEDVVKLGIDPSTKLLLPVVIAVKEIPAGQELRMNYRYDKETIKNIITRSS